MSRLQDVTYVTSPFLRLVGWARIRRHFLLSRYTIESFISCSVINDASNDEYMAAIFSTRSEKDHPWLCNFKKQQLLHCLNYQIWMRSSINSIIILKKTTRLYCSWSEGNNSFKKITDFVKLSLHHENLSELEKGVEYLVENYTLLYFCSSITANSVPMLLNDYEEKKINEFSWYNHKFDREKPFPAIKTWRDLWHTP